MQLKTALRRKLGFLGSGLVFCYEIFCSYSQRSSALILWILFNLVNPLWAHKNRRATDRYTAIR